MFVPVSWYGDDHRMMSAVCRQASAPHRVCHLMKRETQSNTFLGPDTCNKAHKLYHTCSLKVDPFLFLSDWSPWWHRKTVQTMFGFYFWHAEKVVGNCFSFSYSCFQLGFLVQTKIFIVSSPWHQILTTLLSLKYKQSVHWWWCPVALSTESKCYKTTPDMSPQGISYVILPLMENKGALPHHTMWWKNSKSCHLLTTSSDLWCACDLVLNL